MKRWLMMAALAAGGIASLALAQSQPSAANPLVTDKWRFRPLIVITPSANAPAYRSIRDQLDQSQAQFSDREMMLYTIENGDGRRHGKPMTVHETQALLEALDVDPDRRVTVILVGKDGGKKVEQRGDVDLQQIYDTIDRMPMRRTSEG